jgi:hypothetical protein
VENGDVPAAVAGVKAKATVFPLSEAANPPPTPFINVSGRKFNTISANDFSFYDELNGVVQNEPADWVDPDDFMPPSAFGKERPSPRTRG